MVKDCIFFFSGSLFMQKYGTAVGNPLGPCLANAFLSHHEVSWLKNSPPEFKPLFYRRYVDDMFIIFKSPDYVPLFLKCLNSQYENNKFTSEIEEYGTLSFLDIEITKSNNTFLTSVYRKPTFTGLMTKFDSFVPVKYKKNLVQTLITRAYNLCSNYFNFHIEMQRLRERLKDNGYPLPFTDKYIGIQLNKLKDSNSNITTASKKLLYCSIPFLGKQSFTIRNKVKRPVQKFYPQLCLRMIFQPQAGLGDWFHIRDNIPCVLRSLVVYLYKCSICNATYIGQRKRQLRTRISEHKGVSYQTNIPLTTTKINKIYQPFEPIERIQTTPYIQKILKSCSLLPTSRRASYPSLCLSDISNQHFVPRTPPLLYCSLEVLRFVRFFLFM